MDKSLPLKKITYFKNPDEFRSIVTSLDGTYTFLGSHSYTFTFPQEFLVEKHTTPALDKNRFEELMKRIFNVYPECLLPNKRIYCTMTPSKADYSVTIQFTCNLTIRIPSTTRVSCQTLIDNLLSAKGEWITFDRIVISGVRSPQFYNGQFTPYKGSPSINFDDAYPVMEENGDLEFRPTPPSDRIFFSITC